MAVNKEVNLIINAKDGASKTLGDIGNSASGLSSRLALVGKVAVASFAAVGTAALGAGAMAVKSAAQFEQQQIAFETLLGSTESANKALNRIKEDAKKTPFELSGLISMNQRLISTGIEADRAADVILSLGDAIAASGGSQEVMDRMISNLQQIKNVGQATAMDIRQFGMAGINIYGLLADSMGKGVEEIKQLENITFEDIELAFMKASEEGGKFFGAMENQSQSFNGIVSNIKDTIGIMAVDFANQSGLFSFVKAILESVRVSLERIFAVLTPLMASWKEGMASIWQSEFIQGITGFFQSVITVIASFGQGIKEGVLDNWNMIVTVYEAYLKPALENLGMALGIVSDEQDQAAGFAQKLGKFLADVVVPAIAMVILIISGLIQVFVKWINWTTEVRLKITNLFLDIKQRAIETKDRFNEFIDGFKRGIDSAVTSVKDFKDKVSEYIDKVIKKIKEIPAVTVATDVIEGGKKFVSENFSSGGIVGGGSYHGDRVFAGLNSGEMVLNKQQQSNLMSMLNNGGGGGGSVNFNVSIPYYTGDDQAKRRVAEEIWKELDRIAKSKNTNLANLSI